MRAAVRSGAAALLPSLALASGVAGQGEGLPGFVRSPWFGEQVRVVDLDEGVRVCWNAPRDLAAEAVLEVVLFATPNGNTIEHTLGCRPAPGLDWRYDIQHVAAQVRRLREVAPEQNVVLGCLEADGLSWPAWRARRGGGGAGARALVTRALEALPGPVESLVLCGHSGGGSFLFGYLEDGEGIPAIVQRIAFLDANYGFDGALHGAKLLSWLRGSPANHLVVLAYDDRDVVFRGRKIVGPTGGTLRATQRMLDAFADELAFERSSSGDVERAVALDGRVTVLRHRNPENRILHTALVGEMNGLLFALTAGGVHAGDWGTFGGARAYARWIQPVPGTGIEPAQPAEPMSIPPRPHDAPSGRAVLEAVAELPLRRREERILEEIERGNVPDFLRRPVAVELEVDDADGARHCVRLRVAPDYLAVGGDQDFVRVPLTPMSAQHVADRFGFALPTRRMVAQIHEHAAVRLEPRPLGEPRQAVATFVTHNDLIEEQRAGRRLGLLVDGIKKDVVVTPRLVSAPGKVAIFGWHHPDGAPIQPLYLGHIATYVDYSHGVRLVWPEVEVEVDGRERALVDVLGDPVLHPLLSDEGPVPPGAQRYRGW